MEIEIKLGPVQPDVAAKIFDDTALLPAAGEEARIRMRTVYYDDALQRLSAGHFTLRLRQENELSVCTFKTPAKGFARVEVECEAQTVEAGAAILAEHPQLPREAADILRDGTFLPRCGARFLRRTRLCRVGDTTFHLCLDEGVLENGARSLPLCELELELIEGSVQVLQNRAALLMRGYGLQICSKSKQQRAMELGREDA